MRVVFVGLYNEVKTKHVTFFSFVCLVWFADFVWFLFGFSGLFGCMMLHVLKQMVTCFWSADFVNVVQQVFLTTLLLLCLVILSCNLSFLCLGTGSCRGKSVSLMCFGLKPDFPNLKK